jgi:general stress protein YciG
MTKKQTRTAIKRRGFASMDPYKQSLIASKGGKKTHELGRAHTWTSEEVRKAGAIGGKVLKYSKHK